ncbi:MAG: CvpA family protein, partial [Suilimivivens sp.]
MYYIALIIVALIFIWRIVTGFKKGMVQEIISLIAMAVAGFCVLLILGAVSSYLNKEIGQLIQFVIVLLVICVVYRLINILFTSLQLISKLPIIKWVDKLLGIVVGLAEAALVVGVLVYFVKSWGLS